MIQQAVIQQTVVPMAPRFKEQRLLCFTVHHEDKTKGPIMITCLLPILLFMIDFLFRGETPADRCPGGGDEPKINCWTEENPAEECAKKSAEAGRGGAFVLIFLAIWGGIYIARCSAVPLAFRAQPNKSAMCIACGLDWYCVFCSLLGLLAAASILGNCETETTRNSELLKYQMNQCDPNANGWSCLPACTNTSVATNVGTVCDTMGTKEHGDKFPDNKNSCMEKLVETCEIRRSAQLPWAIICFLLWAASGFLTTHLNMNAKEFQAIVAMPAGIPMQGQPMMAQPVMGAVVGQPPMAGVPQQQAGMGVPQVAVQGQPVYGQQQAAPVAGQPTL